MTVSPSGKPSATLTFHLDKAADLELELGETQITVGRDASCDLVIPTELKTISRKHAHFVFDGDAVSVNDPGSQNGVFVDGVRISDWFRLTGNEEICLGLMEGFSEVRVSVQLPEIVPPIPVEPAGPGSRPYLAIRWPDSSLTTFDLTGDQQIAGRGADAVLKFPDKYSFVSEHHFEINLQGGEYRINDLKSRNGTRLNNRLLEPGTPAPLNDGDIIRIGDDQLGVSLGLVFHQPDRAFLTQGGWKPLSATIVTKRQKEFTIGREADNDLQLTSLTISRHHARITEADDEYMISDIGSRNGTIVNGARIKSARLFDGDLIEIGDHLLQFQGGMITPYTSQGFRLDVIGLSKTVRDGRGSREIIKGIDLTVLPKEFVAVVGASGAGKTTFLRALNGTSPGSGKVLINGHDFYEEYDLFRHQLGYVPQFEILHTSLTVDQALGYAARLRLPSETTPEKRKERIDRALKTVGMDQPENRGNKIANLSGGQRKRVSIAVELLADPRLIFLDEATSGLDPGLEKKMMYTLRRMADEGRTVVLITHATANIVQADHVMFLTQGRMVYFGSPQEALAFFEVEEFADIYDQIEMQGENWEKVFKTDKAEVYQKNVVERQQSQRALPVQEIKPHRRTLADFFRQLAVLTGRAFKVISSDWIALLLLMLLFPLTATLQLVIATPEIITGDLLLLADPVAAARTAIAPYIPFPSMNTFVFVMGLEAVLVGLFVPSTELLKERTIYRRERMINLGIIPYLFSKVIVFTLFSFIQVLMYMIVLSIGVDYPADGVFLPGAVEIFLTLFLTMLAGNGLGLVVSALSRNNEIAIYLLTLMLFFQFFFAGTVFDLRGKAAEPLSYMTTTRWSLSALGSTIGMEDITAGTILCSTLDNPLTPELDEITSCFNYPEAAEDLMLPYGDRELLQSWGALIFTMLFGLAVTGVLIKRLDTL